MSIGGKRGRGTSVLLVGACLVAMGCNTPGTNRYTEVTPGTEGRIVEEKVRVVDEALARRVDVVDAKSERVDGYLHVEAVLESSSRTPLSVEWRIAWLDEKGFQLDDVSSGWHPCEIEPKGRVVISGVAPLPSAAAFRVLVRRARPLY